MANKTEKIPIPKLKRLFDIIFSLLFLIITSPIFIIFLILIFIEHILRGDFLAPLFYSEDRISQGQPFNLLKFNIFKPKIIKQMKENYEFIATKEVEKNKNNLIKVGLILKKIYLDELPQLINILKGDLSFVGPRPVNLKVYGNSLNKGILNKKIIRAGLTGNFQSQKGLTHKTDVELDGEYIDFCRHNPAWKIILFDVKILLWTIKVMFKAEGI